MKERGTNYPGRSWLCWWILIICASLIKPVQDRLESRLGGSGQEPDVLYFSSPSMVKKMSLGFDYVLADFYWMRTIQYYARRDKADKRLIRYKNLPTLLDITTTLDPGLLDAYIAGSTFLSETEPVGAGQPEQALKLIDKGIKALPGEWKLPYNKGFVYYWFLRDYEAAGEVWRAASRIPGAPHWMEPLAAMSLSKGGSVKMAIALWQNQYRESARADVRENAKNHLLSIEAAADIWILEYLRDKYKEKKGHYPETLGELVRGKEGKYRIVDPLGIPYEYNSINGVIKVSLNTKFKYLFVPDSFKSELLLPTDN